MPIVSLSLDSENAYPSINREPIFDAMKTMPATSAIHTFFHYSYAAKSNIYIYQNSKLKSTVECHDGMKQGEILAGLGYAIGGKKVCEAALHGIDKSEATIVAYHDDITLIGCHESVLAAVCHPAVIPSQTQ